MKTLILASEADAESVLPSLVEPAGIIAGKNDVEALMISTGSTMNYSSNVAGDRELKTTRLVVQNALDPLSIALIVKKHVLRNGFKAIVTDDSQDMLWITGYLSGSLGYPILTEVIKVEVNNSGLLFTRPVYEESLWHKYAYNSDNGLIVSFRSGSYKPSSIKIVEEASIKAEEKIMLKGKIRINEVAGTEKHSFRKAKIIVGAGLGIIEPQRLEMIDELARILGGEWGVTRPLVDNGWAPRWRMIGQSGVRVSPELYLALGLSGASYHVSGVLGAKTIIAVNKDPSAPIFKYCDYGLIADLTNVLPQLISKLKKTLNKT